MILLEYQNIKTFLQKVTLQIGLKKFSLLKNLKLLCCWHILLMIIAVKKLMELLSKKMQKANQKEFRIEKLIKKKDAKLYVKWKGYNNSFDSWIDVKDIVQMPEYFPKTKCLGGNVKIE